MLKYFRLVFIVLFSLIILTCDSGDDTGSDIPSTNNYENEISLTFSGDLSNFDEDEFKNDITISTGAYLEQIQITDYGTVQRNSFYVSFIFIEIEDVDAPSLHECITLIQDDLSDGTFADYDNVEIIIANMSDDVECFLDCAGDCIGNSGLDCAGDCGGTAFYDGCDICGGNNSLCEDECGVINGAGIGEITDGCLLQIPEESDGVLSLTSSGSILYYSNEPIAGFQFTLNGTFIDGILEGADAEDAGFNIATGSSEILGFSLSGSVIPAGCGVLTNLDLHCNATGINNITISNASAQELNFIYYQNINTCDCEGNIEDCSGVCGGNNTNYYQCDDGCTVCDESDCIEVIVSICDSCSNTYDFDSSEEDFYYECCDAAWQEDQRTCHELELYYSYDCSGCQCPGDCETQGLFTCPDGTCTDSLDNCMSCLDSGLVDDCSGDGDCCSIEWIGDGYCDGVLQNYGCNLLCYGLDQNDLCWIDNGDDNIYDLSLCSEESLGDDGDCEEEEEEDTTACDDAAGHSIWISDGWCDLENNNAICEYDGGDCCPCDCIDADYECEDHGGGCDECLDSNSTCSNYEGDCGVDCGDGECFGDETAEDCPEDCDTCSDVGGVLEWNSDGWCDESNNIAACEYDGGDCCPSDCLEFVEENCYPNDENDNDSCFGESCYDGSCCGDCSECVNPESQDLIEGGECVEGRNISSPDYKDKKNKKLFILNYQRDIDNTNSSDKSKNIKRIY